MNMKTGMPTLTLTMALFLTLTEWNALAQELASHVAKHFGTLHLWQEQRRRVGRHKQSQVVFYLQFGTFEQTVIIDFMSFLCHYCYSLVNSYSYTTMVLLRIQLALFSQLWSRTLVNVVTQSSSDKKLRSAIESVLRLPCIFGAQTVKLSN